MKLASMMPVAVVSLMLMTLTGCANHEKRLIDASVAQAVAEADVFLPARPAECVERRKEAHASLVAGAEVRTVLRNERKALERQQDRHDRCEIFYDEVWKSY